MKKKSLIIILILILIIALVISQKSNIIKIAQTLKIQMYGEPIAGDGTINNKYFGIDYENYSATTKGLNDVVSYANKNGIEYIKLEKNTYTVNDSIYLKDNIELDLNGSTIQYATNSKINYAIFRINNVENVKVKNGFLIGDRETHDYDSVNSTHEWGVGVNIRSSKNVEIGGLQISQMTGDGIYIAQDENKKYEAASENVKIYNCNIRENRRQGISIICGKNIEIFDNEIHTIDGTAPKSGIDCEANYDYEICENIKIYRNKIYNINNISIVLTQNISNVQIFENELEGRFLVNEERNELIISDNIIKNGNFQIITSKSKIDKGHYINKIKINNNTFYNSDLLFRRNNDIELENNTINNGVITVQSSNAKIYGNKISNETPKLYVYNFEKYTGDNYDDESRYKIYMKNNSKIGKYVNEYVNAEFVDIINE